MENKGTDEHKLATTSLNHKILKVYRWPWKPIINEKLRLWITITKIWINNTIIAKWIKQINLIKTRK